MFWFAPMFGAVVAAYLYEYGSLKPENFAGAKDMDTAIFQAGKRKKKRHSVNEAPTAPAPLKHVIGDEVENVLHAPQVVRDLPPPPAAPGRAAKTVTLSAVTPAPAPVPAAAPAPVMAPAPLSAAPQVAPSPKKPTAPKAAAPAVPPAPSTPVPAVPTGFDEMEDEDIL